MWHDGSGPAWSCRVGCRSRGYRGRYIGRHFLTQSRPVLSLLLGHRRFRSRADRRSSIMRRTEHPLATPLGIAVRSSQCVVFAGDTHTRSSRSTVSFRQMSHHVIHRDYRSGNKSKPLVSYRRQTRPTVGIDRGQRDHLRVTFHQTLGGTVGSSPQTGEIGSHVDRRFIFEPSLPGRITCLKEVLDVVAVVYPVNCIDRLSATNTAPPHRNSATALH